MKTKKQYNRLLFIFIPTVMIFLTVFVWGLGLFTDIEEEPYVSGETDRDRKSTRLNSSHS